MVFMTVGNDDSFHLVAILLEVGEIGNDVIDPQHIVFGEHETGIDNQDLIVIFVRHHIGTDFPQATQGNNS